MATIKINGKEITVEDNTLILDAARDAGHEIPTFCYQADLMGVGSCRMCLIEIEGQKKLQPSCVTPVLHGMSILTDSPNVKTARASVLEFLLANHALDCPVCDKGGECELQDMVMKYGPHKGRHSEKKFAFHDKDYVLSPVIIKNSNRCVQCMKCVRVCREVVGVNILGALNRGDHQEATSFLRTQLDCDHCGNCIEVCPVGCFMRLPYRYKSRPWDLKGADTVCPYCATGCRMVIEHRDGLVIRSRAQLGVGVNSETLCARGRFGFDFINSEERLTTPMVRWAGGARREATWAEAAGFIKENLSAFDGRTIGGVVSPRYTNEEIYLFQKLMRQTLKSPNVDSTSRWDSSAVESYVEAMGMAEGGTSMFDCMDADTLLVIGSQISDENPITDYTVRRISGARRMTVAIASVRAMKLDSSANILLRHNPAAEHALLSAIIMSLNSDKMPATPALDAIKAGKLDEHIKTAGIDADKLTQLVQRLKSAEKVSIFAGTEFLRNPEGIAPLGLLIKLLKSLGKNVKSLPLLDRSNQRGAWEMGAHPSFGVGYSKVEERGAGLHEMLKRAMNGEINALYLAGVDIVSMFPDEEYVRRALMKVKLIIVQDAFMTETAKVAHVLLPSSTFAEKDGFYTNQEGRAQAIRKLLPLPGKAKRDFDIIRAIGEQIDRDFGPKNIDLVQDEIRRSTAMYFDVSLAFNNKRNTDNKLDNKAALVRGANASLSAASYPAKPQASNPEYPFRLITGNHLFHSGKLSRRTVSLTGLIKAAVVEISAEDAARLGLKAGEKVRVKSASYEAVMTLTVKEGSKSGAAFIAENFDDVQVNRYFKDGSSVAFVSITLA